MFPCMHVLHHVHAWYQQSSEEDPLELKLLVVVNHHVGSEN